MIGAKTRVVGLLGWPVEHSMSPVIHNAAFKAAGLDYVYVGLPVRPEDIDQALAGVKALGFSGVNVTVPHKVKVLPYLDALDRSAELVGAVNTVVVAEGRAIGYNSDMAGFVNSLLAEGVAIEGKRAILLGAGGAARAVVCGLLDNGIRQVTVGSRDKAKAADFAASFDRNEAVTGCNWGEGSFVEALGMGDIVINCTPLGMYPREDEQPPLDWAAVNPRAVFCDLIYNPAASGFLTRARAAGHKTIGGAGMLVEQAAIAFTLWTGVPAPREMMYQTLAEALGTK